MADRSWSEKTVVLPKVMDLRAAAPLANELLATRGHLLRLDASCVETIGTLCLQVLLSARLTWKTDNVPLVVVTPSLAFSDAMRLFGAPSFIN